MPKKKSLKNPPPPNSDDEAQLWWTVHERRDFLEEKIREWEGNDTNNLATKEHRLAQLHALLEEVEELLVREPDDVSRLKRWHSGLTQKQRDSWAHSMEPFPRPSRRHDVLSPIIQRAVAETQDSSEVYVWLKEQALVETPPLTGVDEDGAILYASGKNKQARLTRDALRKRLDRLTQNSR